MRAEFHAGRSHGTDEAGLKRFSSRGPAAIADQPHRVDIQEQGSRTALSTRFRIEDVRLSKGESEGLHASRILMKQVPQVCCRPVSIRDCEKHPTPCYVM